jgi:hypothetical protein
MPVTPEAAALEGSGPASEHTQIQRRAEPRTIAAGDLEYHLYRPRQSRAPLLDQAYEVWRDVWQRTFEEADGVAEVHSDEFTRQDEIGVLSCNGCCISVTGLRWMDFGRPRSRHDSYFKHWPAEVLASLSPSLLMVTSNTIVHPDWRGTRIQLPSGMDGEAARLAFVTIAMSIRRFLDSPALDAVGLSRNDRAMNRVAVSLGGMPLARLWHHGEEADIMHFTRASATPHGPVVDELWSRRRLGK